MRIRFLHIAAAAAAGALGACAAASQQGSTQGFGGAELGGGAVSSSSSSSGGDLGGGSFATSSGAAASSSSGGPQVFSAYAHTNTTLYKLDPSAPNLGLTKIGDFDCIGGSGQDTSMTDIAVNESGDLWAISAKNVYSLVIQGGTVHCAKTIPLNNPKSVKFYALTFAPAGVVDPAKEVLVAGNTDGQLWAVDANGNLTQHGSFGAVPPNDGRGHTYPYAGTAWELSGDLVFLANNGSPIGFATVRDCPSPPSSNGCDPVDTLIQIDMTKLKTSGAQDVTLGVRGQIVKDATCNDPSSTGYGSMYGIAAWNDKVYGFSHKGAIVEIDNNTGGACLVESTASDAWAGAGVTTIAPIQPPPPPQ